ARAELLLASDAGTFRRLLLALATRLCLAVLAGGPLRSGLLGAPVVVLALPLGLSLAPGGELRIARGRRGCGRRGRLGDERQGRGGCGGRGIRRGRGRCI